jgi:hypothetical protein
LTMQLSALITKLELPRTIAILVVVAVA